MNPISLRSIIAIGVAALGLATGNPLSAQTTATSSWVGGAAGDWGSLSNWHYDYYNSSTGASGGYDALKLPGDNVSGRTNVRFDNTAMAHAVTLSSPLASTHSPANETWVESFTVASGTWDYYLKNGALINGYGGSLTPTKMTFGEGANTVHVSFNADNATSKIYLSNLTLAGAGNSIGTTNATINFNTAPVVTAGFNALAVSGSNNVFRVSNGSTFNNLNPITVTMAAGSSNNRIEVDGIGAVLNAGSYSISGTVGAANQLAVKNGGTITTSNSFAVGSGGQLLVDGVGSKVTLGESSPVTALSVEAGGEAVIQNQATASLSGYATITGHMTVNNATVSQKLSAGNNNYQTLLVRGRLDLQNGARLDSTSTGPNPAGMTVSTSGVVALTDQSEMNVQGLAIESGAQVQITGNSKLTTQNWQAMNAEGLSVESGSTFRFEKLEFTAKGQEYTLANNGVVTWGSGNSTTTYTDNVLHISSGTTLKLTGDTYTAGGSGKIIAEDGGKVEGDGQISLSLDTGHLTIGAEDDTAGKSIIGNTSVKGNSVLELDVFTNGDYLDGGDWIKGDYDHIEGRLAFETSSGNLLTIEVSVAEGVIGEHDWQAGDRFQLVDDWSINLSSNSLVFDFGTSVAELAARGLGWDTSHFAEHGYLEIVAIPEPSTWLLMGLGLVVTCYSLRRRALSRQS